jgi:hypothetical protein
VPLTILTTQLPKCCSDFFRRREVFDVVDRARADEDDRALFEDRLHQGGNAGSGVLIVGVGVDDHIGAELEGALEPRHECPRQALMVLEHQHMIRAMLAGHGRRAVAAAIVNDEPFHHFETVYRLGQVAQRRRERVGLVETGNLNDQLHGSALARGFRPWTI